MKVFRVVTERDGLVEKTSGHRSVEIVRTEYRYAASTIQQVWKAIDWIHTHPEETLIAILEEHPDINILGEEEHVD